MNETENFFDKLNETLLKEIGAEKK